MSTNKTTQKLQTIGPPEQVQVSISFQLGGGAGTSITASNIKGYCSGVNQSATGTYVVTIPTTFPDLITGFPGVQCANITTSFDLKLGPYSPTAGTLQVFTTNTGTTTAVSVAANVNARAHLNLIFRNSGVTR